MHIRPLLTGIGALGLITGAMFVVFEAAHIAIEENTDNAAQVTAATQMNAASTLASTIATSQAATTTPISPAAAKASTTPKAKKASIVDAKSAPIAVVPIATTSDQVVRIENPYPTPPLSFEEVNDRARAALVNIVCTASAGGNVKPISGSGIIIDSRGIILTNAHVAQYVLLSQNPQTDLACQIRSGAPAVAKWLPVVMYIPPVWIEIHAADITRSRPVGTGEHDYALLYIAANVDGSPRSASYPALDIDTREAIGFVDDAVLAASYPVEFIGNFAAQSNLYPVSSITTIKKLMTFGHGTVDALSLGGIISAQGGSSGGAVVNQWSRVIGIVTTTSDGATTAERDLHAISLSYISRDLAGLTTQNLNETLAGNPYNRAMEFNAKYAGRLTQLLIDQIQKGQ